MKTRVALVIPYFGKQPAWFEYYIRSCGSNPQLDWLFFTDCLQTTQQFRNLKFIPFTLRQFNELATAQLGFPVQIEHSYKLCDLKPAYGEIFESYLEGYDFWGYGDIDLIYGRILSFLPENWYQHYDVLSNHRNFIPGHLCLLRNHPDIIRLYRKVPGYQRIFQSAAYWGFDEVIQPVRQKTHGIWMEFYKNLNRYHHLVYSRLRCFVRKYFPKKNTPDPPAQRQVKDFTTLVFNLENQGAIRAHFKTNYSCDLMLRRKGYRRWLARWNEGRCHDCTRNKEVMYFHFMLAKKRKGYQQAAPMLPNASFTLTETRIG